MPTLSLTLTDRPKTLVRGTIPQGGTSPSGEAFTVNNYFFERNGRPFYAVAGEFHYSRYDQRFWEESLAKMKAGGINLVSTYVFWNHHEEVEGEFEWTGRKDLRRFVELCATYGLKAIVRIGPFCHGEVRNGGFPDWLYGRPFEARSNDEGYLVLVRRLYAQIADQIRGLFFQDGGPILAIQIENEYQHSAAPWETTTATSKDWLPGGRDGRDHMLELKRIARAAGIEAPFWTATAWGGANVPLPEALPLWGGYAYQPWLFYGDVKVHPATPEFLFRDHHNNAQPKTYNFEPAYAPEDYPYSCCEMGGGMQVWYPYRFTVPPASVEAMAVVKAAGGCNFLGYYMYHGGTNPYGRVNPFLNEHTSPKLSYDFQAPLGELGQARDHFHRLRLLHSLFTTWQDWVAPLPTVLPPAAEEIDPKDNTAVRWSLRTDGRRGLLFVTNFQDHWQREDLRDLAWELETPAGPVRFPAEGTVGLAADESCVLPFHFPLGSVDLVSATAQPVTVVQAGAQRVWVFAAPAGMAPVFHFDRITGGKTVRAAPGQAFTVRGTDGSEETILVLAKEEALGLQQVDTDRGTFLVGTPGLVFPAPGNTGGFRVETQGDDPVTLRVFPPLPEGTGTAGGALVRTGDAGLFATYRLDLAPRPAAGRELAVGRLGDRKARVTFDPAALTGVRDLVVRIAYDGDVGNAYVDGRLVADNYANGTPWEISLARIDPRVFDAGMVIDVVPVKQGGKVVHDTTMAGRKEEAGALVGALGAIEAVPVRQVLVAWPRP
jgi:hypothetical protein